MTSNPGNNGRSFASTINMKSNNNPELYSFLSFYVILEPRLQLRVL